ncbi:MAG: dTMP kinase [Alcaligenaceae bacterium]|jgi:dTMP kinase|nr:MAG: dTMP kinase [Alcaligenaceae bacterium]
MRPQFIVFEGLDGSGTSTQASMLEKALLADGRKVMLTSEPSPGPVGNMIRQAFKGRIKFQADQEKFDRQMAYLFAADRYDHLYNDIDGVIPMMTRGMTVISTRYYFSSFAYHCSQAEHWELVHRLNQDFPAPDLLVYLRNPVDESVRRLSNRPTLDSYETAEKLTVVAQNYERIFAEFIGRKIVLNATQGANEIHKSIRMELGSQNA